MQTAQLTNSLQLNSGGLICDAHRKGTSFAHASPSRFSETSSFAEVGLPYRWARCRRGTPAPPRHVYGAPSVYRPTHLHTLRRSCIQHEMQLPPSLHTCVTGTRARLLITHVPHRCLKYLTIHIRALIQVTPVLLTKCLPLAFLSSVPALQARHLRPSSR